MMIVFVGPSGVGKGFVAQHIVQTWPHAVELTWFTTRPLRPEETQQRRNRRHVSLEAFREHVDHNRALLAQEVHGHLYALDRQSIPEGDTDLCFTELHVDVLSYVDELPEPRRLIGLIPTDFDILHAQLLARPGVETTEQIEQRLVAARHESALIAQQASRFDLIVPLHKVRDPTLVPRVLSYLHSILTLPEP